MRSELLLQGQRYQNNEAFDVKKLVTLFWWVVAQLWLPEKLNTKFKEYLYLTPQESCMKKVKRKQTYTL